MSYIAGWNWVDISVFHQILHMLINQNKFLLLDNITPIRVSSGSHVLIEWTIPECTNLHGFLLWCFLLYSFPVGWGLGAYGHLGSRGVLQDQLFEFLTVQVWRTIDGLKVLVCTMHLEELQGGEEISGYRWTYGRRVEKRNHNTEVLFWVGCIHHRIRSLLQKVGWEVEGERRWEVWGDEVWPDRQWVQQELTTQPVPGRAFGASLPLLSARCLPHSTNSSLHLHYQPLVMTVCTAMFSTAGLCSLRYISGAASLHKGSNLPTISQKLSIRARARPRQQGFQLGLENKTHTHTT